MRKTLFIGLFWLFLLAAGLLATQTSLAANLWNTRFVKADATGEAPPEPLSTLKWQQQVWLGRAALQRDNLPVARAALMDLESTSEPLAVAALGELYAAEGDTQKAVQVWISQENYYAIRRASEQAEMKGRDTDTQEYYRAMQTLRPEEATWLYTNYLWVTKKNAPKTEKLLIQAISDHPKSSYQTGWLLRLGEVLRVQGKFLESEKIFRQLLAEDPENIQARIELGRLVYEQEKDPDKVLEYFKELINLYPEAGIAMVAAGEILVREGDFQAAEQWYDQALITQPENNSWQLSKANIVRNSGDLDRSIILYQSILNRSPNYSQAYYDLSWAYRLDEQPYPAANAIETALKNDPNNEDYLLRAGAVYVWINKENEAKNAYIKLLTLNPCNNQARRELERLGFLIDSLPPCTN